MKITESELQKVIQESITKVLNEYRDLTGDGNYMYHRPNGENYVTNLPDKSGIFFNKSANLNNHDFYSGIANTNGKGKLITKVIRTMEDELGINFLNGNLDGKIQWTPQESECLKNIWNELRNLVTLTKQEGNKKRGYTNN